MDVVLISILHTLAANIKHQEISWREIVILSQQSSPNKQSMDKVRQ
jgi:hypothetical protein